MCVYAYLATCRTLKQVFSRFSDHRTKQPKSNNKVMLSNRINTWSALNGGCLMFDLYIVFAKRI